MGQATIQVTAAWTPPATITGFSGTPVEESSHIKLNWDASTMSDTDFAYYNLYRREVGADAFDLLVQITNKTTTEHIDRFAGQQVNYEYMIIQYQNIPGDVELEGEQSEIVTAILSTDAWFTIIHSDGAYTPLEFNVIEETHNDVIQQEIFEPIASDRKRIVRGNVLGQEGSMQFLVDVSVVPTYITQLKNVRRSPGPHILKSPFGDVWEVEFDAPGYRYQPAGHLEVTIGWVQID